MFCFYERNKNINEITFVKVRCVFVGALLSLAIPFASISLCLWCVRCYNSVLFVRLPLSVFSGVIFPLSLRFSASLPRIYFWGINSTRSVCVLFFCFALLVSWLLLLLLLLLLPFCLFFLFLSGSLFVLCQLCYIKIVLCIFN